MVQLPCAAFCVRRLGHTKTRPEHHLSKWRSVVTEAKVVVDRLDRKNYLFGTFQRRY